MKWIMLGGRRCKSPKNLSLFSVLSSSASVSISSPSSSKCRDGKSEIVPGMISTPSPASAKGIEQHRSNSQSNSRKYVQESGTYALDTVLMDVRRRQVEPCYQYNSWKSFGQMNESSRKYRFVICFHQVTRAL